MRNCPTGGGQGSWQEIRGRKKIIVKEKIVAILAILNDKSPLHCPALFC